MRHRTCPHNSRHSARFAIPIRITPDASDPHHLSAPQFILV
ncbi:MAG: hypothetical protein OJF49_002095 [Ktedonobacterales bacterium]|nr:MAG: hypothetical protein OJF49_002095 [Ktedonobacterales bacterium]